MIRSDRQSNAATAALLRRLGVRSIDPATLIAARPAPAAGAAADVELSRRILHLTNGDCAADLLRASGVLGEVSISADALHEGPAPAGLPAERWRKVRARFLAESGYEGYDECLQRLSDWDRKVEEASLYDEVVLWFEHDLFDQLLLIRLLTLLSTQPLAGTRLSLICIGEYPGIEPFHGLGELTPAAMAALYEERLPVRREQTALAREAWLAFCSSDPRALEAILARDTSALPFLAGALRRHLEEYPSTVNGLSRTEQAALAALAAGPLAFGELFRAVQRTEDRLFLGDLSFVRQLRSLAAGPHPLLKLEPAASGGLASLHVALTRSGQQVLSGANDWIFMTGIDRWLGGVHLKGFDSPWRWEPAQQRLLRDPRA
jgi:hypothetical protein